MIALGQHAVRTPLFYKLTIRRRFESGFLHNNLQTKVWDCYLKIWGCGSVVEHFNVNETKSFKNENTVTRKCPNAIVLQAHVGSNPANPAKESERMWHTSYSSPG